MKGSGRTSLIEAVAKEAASLPATRTRILTVQPQHLLHTDETEAEAVLRRVFRRARRWLASGDAVDPPALPGPASDDVAAATGLVGAASSSIAAREASAAARSGDAPVSHTAWQGLGKVADFGHLERDGAGAADADAVARVCVIVIEGLDDLLPALPGVSAGGIGSAPAAQAGGTAREEGVGGTTGGGAEGEDGGAPSGAVLGDSEVAFRAHLLGLLEAHCWCHDAEGLAALPGVRVSGDEGVLSEEALHGSGAGVPVVGCLALDESSADEEEDALSPQQDSRVVSVEPASGGDSGSVGVVSASGLYLGAPGTRAGWRRDSLPSWAPAGGQGVSAQAAASGAGDSAVWPRCGAPVAPRRLVVIGTAASRAAVDPAALEAGMLELEVVIDPPHVSDRPHILASVLKQRQVELLQDPANDEGNDSAASAAGDAAVSPGGMDVAAVRFAEGLIGYVPGDIVSLVDKASELASLEQQAAVARAAAARLASVEQQQLEEGEEAAAVTRGDASYGEDRLRNGMTQGEYDRAWAALADTPAKPDPTESEHSTPAGSSRVQLRHLHAAKALVAGSALQGLQTDVQKASWEDVGGLESVKADLVRAVQWPLLHRRVFDRFHVSPPRGILLFGPPGCSKTLLVRALASTSGASFFSLSGADVYSKYVGQAERNLSEAFRRARAARPAVIFLDEVEALVGSRAGAESASETDGGASSGVLATLLTEMDGTETVEGVVVVAATNRPAALDAALLRPGRFGLRLAVGPPDADGRLAILKVHTRLMTLGADVDLQALAARCSRFTGAELEALCRYADTEAQRECLVRAGTPSGHAAAGAPSAAVPSETTVVTAAHFEAAMGQLSTLFGGPGGEIRLEEAMQAMRKFASGASATGAAAMLGRASAAPAFGVAETDPAAAFRAAAAGGTA